MSNRRRTRAERPTRVVPRDRAVRAIADHLVDRDAFVISIPPALIASAASRLSTLPSCTWYADNGSNTVMRVAAASIAAIEAVDMLLPGMTAGVAIVPKTVPAAQLAAVLNHVTEIADDGSQDLLVLQDDSGVIRWPRLLTEALTVMDPGFALRLAANDVRRLS